MGVMILDILILVTNILFFFYHKLRCGKTEEKKSEDVEKLFQWAGKILGLFKIIVMIII